MGGYGLALAFAFGDRFGAFEVLSLPFAFPFCPSFCRVWLQHGCQDRAGSRKAQEKINDAAIRYANRLSDHLFVMARTANNGMGDVLWVPGSNR